MRTTSLLPGLAEKYEPAAIDWLTSATSRELLDWNKYLRRILTWEERDQVECYDLVIGLEDEKDVCRLVSNVKAEKIIGAYLDNGKIVYTPSAWFDMSIISRYGLERANPLKKTNQKTYQQHMADLLGIKVSPYVFKLAPDEIEYGRKTVRDLGVGKGEKIIGINTGAGQPLAAKELGDRTDDRPDQARQKRAGRRLACPRGGMSGTGTRRSPARPACRTPAFIHCASSPQ